jgi:hypothetical protein
MAPYSGAPRLPSAPAVPSLPWTATPTSAMHGGSSVGVSGAYALPSSDGRERGDVVTCTISIDSFDAYTLLTLTLVSRLSQMPLLLVLVFLGRRSANLLWSILPKVLYLVLWFVRGALSSLLMGPLLPILWLFLLSLLMLFWAWIGYLSIEPLYPVFGRPCLCRHLPVER